MTWKRQPAVGSSPGLHGNNLLMKKAIFILVILIFAMLYYLGIFTKRETIPFSKEFFSVETPSTANRVWDLKKTSPINKKELDQLYLQKLDKGIRNIPLLSSLLIREAEQARQKGDTQQAIELANYSVKFSPDLPQPYYELARALWNQSPLQISIFSQILKGWTAQFRHYPSSLKVLYNAFYILSNAILLAFMIFGIVVLIKYLPLSIYDVRKNLTGEISKLVINGIKILVLFIPFFLRLDILWAILFWSTLLWGYVKKRERIFILVFLIVLVYFPFFLRSSSSFLDTPSSEIVLEMSRANHEVWGKTTEEKLRSWLSIYPEDPEIIFTLGLIEKREGRYAQAEESYKMAIQQNPKFSEAFSNLGNVYLAQKQTAPAIASYQQAVDLNPNHGAYYYNLYRAHTQETFLSGKPDKFFQKARELAPEIVDYYSSIDSPHINRLVIDEIVTAQRLRKRLLSQFIGREGILFRSFKAWFEKIPSRVPFLAPLIFLGFLIGMSSYCRTKKFITRCPMCGSPTYRFYMGASDEEFICFNCHRIFLQKEKLHPRIEEKKSIQVRRFQRENDTVGAFLSLFFVGFGYLWREHSLKGILFLILFFIFILNFLYWNGVIPSSMTSLSFPLWKAIVWGGLFILFYFFSICQISRLKPRYEIEK